MDKRDHRHPRHPCHPRHPITLFKQNKSSTQNLIEYLSNIGLLLI